MYRFAIMHLQDYVPSICIKHVVGMQFVKRMGVFTEKTHVMVQPTVLIMREVPKTKCTSPATIVDKLNVGWLVKYFLVFDDDVVCLICFLSTCMWCVTYMPWE